MLATWLAIHQTEPEPADRRIDYGGVATLSLGLVSLLVALDQVTDWGWGDPRIVVLLALCAVMLVGFGFVERRMDEAALIPRDVIANRDFSTACLAVLLMSAVFFASLLYLPQFMQKILGYSPLKSGVGLVPMMGTFALTSFIAGPLYARLGAKLIVSLGCAAIAVGILLLSLVGRNSGYGGLVAGMLVLGVGIGLFYSSITTASVTALDSSRAGLAGGIVYMFQIAGGSVGLGLNTTIFTSSSKSNLNSHLESARRDGHERSRTSCTASSRARRRASRCSGSSRRASRSACPRSCATRSWPACTRPFAWTRRSRSARCSSPCCSSAAGARRGAAGRSDRVAVPREGFL